MILLILEEFHFYNMSVFRNYGVFLQNNFGITQHNSVQIKRTIKKKLKENSWNRMNTEKLNFTWELCSVILFRNVQNPSEIREQLI